MQERELFCCGRFLQSGCSAYCCGTGPTISGSTSGCNFSPASPCHCCFNVSAEIHRHILLVHRCGALRNLPSCLNSTTVRSIRPDRSSADIRLSTRGSSCLFRGPEIFPDSRAIVLI